MSTVHGRVCARACAAPNNGMNPTAASLRSAAAGYAERYAYPTMRSCAAVDSNALSYLLNSVEEGYDPASDLSDVREERVAMLRCYFYADGTFWVPQTVQRECARICDAAKHESHDWVEEELALGPPSSRRS